MVDHGDLKVTETAEGTCYKPDSVTQLLREVRQLAEEHTFDELTQELNAIGGEIDGWKERFEVDYLAEELDLERSEHVREVGRSVAELRD
jgi:hypothetical protein